MRPSWLGGRRGLVGQQVALAEDDELAVDAADRLHDVDVLADDAVMSFDAVSACARLF